MQYIFPLAGNGSLLPFSRFFALASLLFLLVMWLPKQLVAQTVVWSESFPTTQSTWHSRPGSGTWDLLETSAGNWALYSINAGQGNGSAGDSAYYAFPVNPEFLVLVPDRSYRISLTCSLASSSGSKSLVLGLSTNTQSLRASAWPVLQTGALSTNGWQTVTQTFHTMGIPAQNRHIPVLYTPVLDSPGNAKVFVDNIVLELLPNQFPDVPLLTAPALNELVNSPVNITATATDPDGNLAGVRFYADGQLLGQDLTAPYSFPANLSPGSHSLSVQAFDDLGLVRNSASRSIVVNSPPTAQSLSPANGAFFNQGPVVLEASASDPNQNLESVEFYVNGQLVHTALAPPYTYAYENEAGGIFTWYARAVDLMGLWDNSPSRTFEIEAPPTTAIVSPENGARLGSCRVYVQAETSAGAGADRVFFYRNDTLVGVDSLAPFEYFASDWAAGTYTLKARGKMASGQWLQAAQITVIVEEAILAVNHWETATNCQYRIEGKVGPNQTYTLSGHPDALTESGMPFTGLSITTGPDSVAWSQILLFPDNAERILTYNLENAYKCRIRGAEWTLHPETGRPVLNPQIELVKGLKQDPNTGQYYYCAGDVDSLYIAPSFASGSGSFQVCHPYDPSQVYQTYATAPFRLENPGLTEGHIQIRAISPLGCPSDAGVELVFGVVDSPSLIATLKSSNGVSIGKANVTGGTAPYQFTWGQGDSCLAPNCDSVMLRKPLIFRTIKVTDSKMCMAELDTALMDSTTLFQASTESLFPGSSIPSIIAVTKIIGSAMADNSVFTNSILGNILPTSNLFIESKHNTQIKLEVFHQITSLSKYFSFRNWPSYFLPGYYKINGNAELNEDIIFSGNEQSKIILEINGNFKMNRNAIFKYIGINPKNIILIVKGVVEINAFRTVETPLIYSEKNILIQSLDFISNGMFSKETIEISNSPISDMALFIGAKIYQTLTDGCDQALPENFNLICNPGFDQMVPGINPTPIPTNPYNFLQSAKGWSVPMEIPSIDLYYDDNILGCPQVNCNDNIQSNTSAYINCHNIPYNSHNPECSVEGGDYWSGLPHRTNSNIKRYMGLYTYAMQNENNSIKSEHGFCSLIEPTVPGKYYLYSFWASPAREEFLVSNKIYSSLCNQYSSPEFVSTDGSQDISFTDINPPGQDRTFLPGIWKNFSKIVKSSGSFTHIAIGNSPGLYLSSDQSEKPEPGCSNYICEDNSPFINAMNDRAYTYFDDFGLTELPSPLSTVYITCGSSAELLPSSPLLDYWLGIGAANHQVTFEWRDYNGVFVSSSLQFSPSPNINTIYYLWIKIGEDGEWTQIGESSVFVGEQDLASIILINVTPPFCLGKQYCFEVLPSSDLNLANYTITWKVKRPNSTSFEEMPNNCINNLFFEGKYQVQAILSPINTSNLCKIGINYTLIIENPRFIVKNSTNNFITFCPPVNNYPIEILSSGIDVIDSYTWTCRTCDPVGGEPVILATTPDPIFHFSTIDGNIGTQAVINGESVRVVRIEVNGDSYNNCVVSSEIIIHIKEPRPGIPLVESKIEDGNWLQVPLSTNVEVCSGNTLSFRGSGTTINDPDDPTISYDWSLFDSFDKEIFPKTTLLGSTNYLVPFLNPGSYKLVVQANGRKDCPTLSRTINIIVANPGELTVFGVPMSEDSPNSLRLNISYLSHFSSPTGQPIAATNFQIRRLNTDGTVANVYINENSNLGQHTFDLYRNINNQELPFPDNFDRLDGNYEAIVTYPGCSLKDKFFLLGRNSLNPIDNTYTTSLRLSGKVFIYQNIEFEKLGNNVVRLEFSNANVFVRGITSVDQTIPVPECFPLEGVAGIVEGTRILMRDNTNLVVRNSTLSAATDRMWRGIVCDNCSLRVEGTNGSFSSIAHAHTGVDFFTSSQKPILVRYTDFINCHIGIRNSSTNGSNSYLAKIIENCSFYSDRRTPMKAPYHDQFGASSCPPEETPAEPWKFITQVGILLEGNANHLATLTSDGLRYPLNHLTFSNCVFGVRVSQNPGPGNTIPKRVDLNECTFRNIGLASVYANYGLNSIRNSRFFFPTQVPGYFNVTGGNPDRPAAFGLYSTSGVSLESNRFEFDQGAVPNKEVTGTFFALAPTETGAEAHELSLRGNTFSNLATSINVVRPSYLGSDPAKVNFTLKCNEFINQPQTAANPITRKGLVIGEGVQVRAPSGNFGTVYLADQIGGSSEFNELGNAYPNANVWPTTSDRISLPIEATTNMPQDVNTEWINSPNWLPIDNQSTPITYYHFFNEFIWNGTLPGVSVAQALAPPRYAVIKANNPGSINPNLNTVAACGNQFDNQPTLFPTRIAVIDSSFTFTPASKPGEVTSLMLGNAVPNPAREEARIEIILPLTSQQATLQFLSLADGKVLLLCQVKKIEKKPWFFWLK